MCQRSEGLPVRTSHVCQRSEGLPVRTSHVCLLSNLDRSALIPWVTVWQTRARSRVLVPKRKSCSLLGLEVLVGLASDYWARNEPSVRATTLINSVRKILGSSWYHGTLAPVGCSPSTRALLTRMTLLKP